MAKISRRPDRGFVLLMVLVAIIVVGVALTTTARRSLQSTLIASESQQAIQRRWGTFSCQKTLLPAASALFEVSDRSTRKQQGKQVAFPSVFQDRIILGGQTFDLLLADEDAKANLNAVFDFGGLRACEQTMKQLVGAFEARSVRLLPERTSQAKKTAKQSSAQESKLAQPSNSGEKLPTLVISPAFRSWGEVFDLVQVQRLAGDDRQLAKMTRQVSLFGTGRLNVFRATDESVLAVCKSVVEDGLAKRVLSKIRDTSLGEVNLILELTITNQEDRAKLQTLLSTSSSSYSLWIETTSKMSRQQRFVTQAPDGRGAIRTTEFSFE